MGKSYSKIRHIQESNLLIEKRFLNSKSLLMEGDDNTYVTQNDQVLYNEKGEEEIDVPKGTKFTRFDGDKSKTKLNGSDVTFFCATTKKKDKIPLRFESKGKYYYSFDLQKKLVSVFCDLKSKNFQGCIKGNCENGYGEYEDGGDVYKGNFKDGEFNGYGVLTYNDGSIYKGNWDGSKKKGYGVLTYNDGSIYKGNWEDGDWTGKGTYTNSSGCKFYGEWNGTYLNGNSYKYYDKITDCQENNQPTNNNDNNQTSNDDEIQIGGVDEYFKGTPVDDKDPFEYLKIKKANGTEEYWFRGVKDKDNYKALTKYPNWRRSKNRIGLDAIKDQINFDERMTDVPENWENRV
jgi:hypothetical protein